MFNLWGKDKKELPKTKRLFERGGINRLLEKVWLLFGRSFLSAFLVQTLQNNLK
jgi:hypothetical protein